MKTEVYLKDSTQVVRVIELSEGSVYKRLKKDWNGTYRVVFGVVTGTMNNGQEIAMTALELDKDDIDTAVFHGSEDLVVYYADPDEIDLTIAEMMDKYNARVTVAERDLEKARKAVENANSIAGMLREGALKRPGIEGNDGGNILEVR